MQTDYTVIGKRLAARRKELGLKQSQVNEMAGLSDKYLSNITGYNSSRCSTGRGGFGTG